MSHYKGSTQVMTNRSFKVGNKVIIHPQALDIIWGNDARYWRVPPVGEPVELLQVCWLEVTGSHPLSGLVKGTEYKVTFKVKTKPDAFGWSDSPVYLMTKVGSRHIWKKADLSQLKNDVETDIPNTSALTFTVPSGSVAEDKVTFGLYEIWRGRWKGGLLIHDVTIEPTSA